MCAAWGSLGLVRDLNSGPAGGEDFFWISGEGFGGLYAGIQLVKVSHFFICFHCHSRQCDS